MGIETNNKIKNRKERSDAIKVEDLMLSSKTLDSNNLHDAMSLSS